MQRGFHESRPNVRVVAIDRGRPAVKRRGIHLILFDMPRPDQAKENHELMFVVRQASEDLELVNQRQPLSDALVSFFFSSRPRRFQTLRNSRRPFVHAFAVLAGDDTPVYLVSIFFVHVRELFNRAVSPNFLLSGP